MSTENPTPQEVLSNARAAYNWLRGQRPSAVTEPEALQWNRLHASFLELEAAQVRLTSMNTKLEEQARSHSVAWASHRQDYTDASNEITRLRAVNQELERVKQNMRDSIARDLPADDELGELLCDAQEAIEWLDTVTGGNVRVADMRRVAGLFRRVETFARSVEVERRRNAVAVNPDAVSDIHMFQGTLEEIRDNTPGNAEVVDGMTRALGYALKIIDREQRARLAKAARR